MGARPSGRPKRTVKRGKDELWFKVHRQYSRKKGGEAQRFRGSQPGHSMKELQEGTRPKSGGEQEGGGLIGDEGRVGGWGSLREEKSAAQEETKTEIASAML